MTMSQQAAAQQPQQPSPTMGNLAVFAFTPKNGQPPKPGSPQWTGSIQCTHDQLQQLAAWSANQPPDDYGKVRINVSLWDTISNDGQTRYLKGNLKIPVNQPYNAGPMLQPPAPHQTPQGNQLPAWSNSQAYQVQQTLPQHPGQTFPTTPNVSQPAGMQPGGQPTAPTWQQPVSQPVANGNYAPQPAMQPVQPVTRPMGQPSQPAPQPMQPMQPMQQQAQPMPQPMQPAQQPVQVHDEIPF